MPIPDYETIMLPLLEAISDSKSRKLGEVADILADNFSLTAEEREHMLPSGLYPTFRSRVGWAKTYLKQAGLLSQPKRGEMAITDAGKALLAEKPEEIDGAVLRRYPAFQAFLSRSSTPRSVTGEQSGIESMTASLQAAVSPQEALEAAALQMRSQLKIEIREAILKASPEFFERLVVSLLLKMGYGGSWEEAGRAVGRSGDGGIDGVINEDRLGLDAIYIQAKRWESNVGEPEIRDFKGALDAKSATKGVFITTSGFTAGALEAARQSRNYKIVLVNGDRLAELMVEHGIGVSTAAIYEIKKLDADFFDLE